MRYEHYELLAEIFEYPAEGYEAKVTKVMQRMGRDYPQLTEVLEPFHAFIQNTNLKNIQEVYLRTFDVQAICCLEMGYVLFGEDYKRGRLLANLANEHNEMQNDCRHELADYLPNMLRLMPLLAKREEKTEVLQELVGLILLPSLERTIAEFDENKLAKKEKVYYKHHKTVLEKSTNNALIYKRPLHVLQQVLEADFPGVPREVPSPDTDFIQTVQTEIENEES